MVKSTLLFLATSYFAWYLERFETAMVYPFDATYSTPENAGEPRMSEFRHVTTDGEELVVWRAAAAPGQPTLFYLPGNSGGLKDRAKRFELLIDRGYGVTALAYRGSSGSSGVPDEFKMTEDAITVAAVEDARPLILYGESFGTAVAIKLAATGVGDAVILEAPFTSVIDLVENQYPDETLDHLITQRWNSLRRIPGVSQPLFVLHGREDRMVPIAMGRMIFENAGSLEKTFLEVAERGHAELWTVETLQAIYDFIDER